MNLYKSILAGEEIRPEDYPAFNRSLDSDETEMMMRLDIPVWVERQENRASDGKTAVMLILEIAQAKDGELPTMEEMGVWGSMIAGGICTEKEVVEGILAWEEADTIEFIDGKETTHVNTGEKVLA